MHSSTESFWNAVEKWRTSSPKPLIRVEGRGGNWDIFSITGTVRGFVRDDFIDFIREDGTLCPIDLRRCKLRVVTIPKELGKMEAVARFTVGCEEDDGSTTRFVFTELRDFGEPN